MPEDEGDRYWGAALDSCILVLEALEQEMPQSDVTEHEESAPHMLPVVSPATMLCEGRDKGCIVESNRNHMGTTVVLQQVADKRRNLKPWVFEG